MDVPGPDFADPTDQTTGTLLDCTHFDMARPSTERPVFWSWLGRCRYGPVFEWQEAIRTAIKEGRSPERLLLLEHEPVFTLGRNASQQDVLAPPEWLAREGVEVWESNRGGQVTYHGPGQLVGYPILSLGPDRRDVGRYVRDLQDVLISSLGDYGIEAHCRTGKEFIGVWVGDHKIASIGVHLSRWITLHGFALNVTTRLDHFNGIVACGLEGVQMTSMEQWSSNLPRMAELARGLASRFGEVFGREMRDAAVAT